MHQFLTSTEGVESQFKEIGMHQFLTLRRRVPVEGDRNSLVEFYVKGWKDVTPKRGGKGQGVKGRAPPRVILGHFTLLFFSLTESGI